jgi:catechol 2,3-dioxygenase-like lactoylglutathione lyase family enzyme
MSSLDHVNLPVADFSRAKAFYRQALAPLGISLLMDLGEDGAGFGRDGKPDFWIGTGPASFQSPESLKVITPIHLAFVARSTAEVDAFYKAARAAGGKDNGEPELRKEYHPGYSGAFVIDPDGHNVEAVFHGGK